MIRKSVLMATAALVAVTLFSIEMSAHARNAKSAAVQEAQDVPAYHSEAPKGTLPKTLSPDKFDDAVAKNAYAMAAKVKEVLYQQPCYCHCDQSENHTSLLDCFVGDHGAHCETCQQEAIFVYTESKKGKSAVAIRKEIMDGKYKEVDLEKYKELVKLDS